MPSHQPDPDLAALRGALDVVGDRWTLLLVAALLPGPSRFNDLGDRLGVAPNVLASRMRDLERDGLILATPYSDRPVRVAYALTDRGRELAGVCALLIAWADREEPTLPTIEPGATSFDPTTLWPDTEPPGNEEAIRFV